MRILVVDDDSATAMSMIRYLQEVGDCDLAQDGDDAIKAFRGSFREAYPFDLICLDILMPKIDGHQTLARIRQIEREEGVQIGEGVKVLMVSACDDEDSILRSFMKLCDGYLTKPVKKKQLLEKLREIELFGPHRRIGR